MENTTAPAFRTFAVEHQQRIASAICSLFLVHDGILYPEDSGPGYVKGMLNAMFRELVNQHEQAKTGDEEGWWSHSDVNYSLASFGTFITSLCDFFDAVGSARVLSDVVAVDPFQHGAEAQRSALGFDLIRYVPKAPQFGTLRGDISPAKGLTYATAFDVIPKAATPVEQPTATTTATPVRNANQRLQDALDRIDAAEGMTAEERLARSVERMAEEAEARKAAEVAEVGKPEGKGGKKLRKTRTKQGR